MIYHHKPQRAGKSQPTNSNYPPQDPPPKKIIQTISDAPIKDTPIISKSSKQKVSKITKPEKIVIKEKQTKQKNIPEKKITKQKPKVSLFRRFFNKIKRIFRRK